MPVLYLSVVVLALLVVYGMRAEQLLTAVVDPFGAEARPIKQAILGYVAYGGAVAAGLFLGVFVLLKTGASAYPALAPASLVLGGTALVVAAHVDTVVFRDYGIHFYEYDVGGMIGDSMARKDLGVRPQDFLAATAGGLAIILLGVLAYGTLAWAAPYLPPWTEGLAGTFLAGVGGMGLLLFGIRQRAVVEDRHELWSILPARALLLPGLGQRPHLAVRPRTGAGGYPDPRRPSTSFPSIVNRKSVVLILADGLRADHVCGPDGLTPALAAFAARQDVIASGRHFGTGPFTEIGLHGLTYGLHGHAYFPLLADGVPSWPLQVFRENGYEVALITGSRVLQFPSSQLLDNFSSAITLDRDQGVFDAASDFIARRRVDAKPYFLVVFYYAPHWPFDEIEATHRRFRPDLHDGRRHAFQDMRDEAFRARVRNSYRNAVIQADQNFSRTFDLVRAEFEEGRTAVAFTSDHGTELWEHGIMGQGCSTFWNEKVVVPFLLGLPGAHPGPEAKKPLCSSHVDLLPTLFDWLGTDPAIPPRSYGHGRSLLAPPDPGAEAVTTLSGRYFPWADRQNALVTEEGKFWFHVARSGREPRDFTIVPGRATDLEDRPLEPASWQFPEGAAHRFKEEFWRFLEPPSRRR